MHRALATIAALTLATACAADGPTLFETDQSFDDATFAVESEILNHGLVLEGTSHIGEMLARTRMDMGSEVMLFEAADAFSFCSAKVSREVMEADIMNVQHCPYAIFVMQKKGSDTVTIGFRDYPGESMAPVRELLTSISQEAADG